MKLPLARKARGLFLDFFKFSLSLIPEKKSTDFTISQAVELSREVIKKQMTLNVSK